MKKLQGFTLIELMIAMAIIAILATAGLAAYTGYIKKSRDTARAEIASNLNTAVMAYAASNGGNPPANSAAFTEFLASAGETFGGSAVIGTTLVKDPVWWKSVCLDAQDGATQPCSFNYTAYDDGTYAISYGVESESSREGSFYKTTKSVVGANITTQAEAGAQIAVAKYGVYVWSAKYIGRPATQSNGNPANNDGVDLDYYSAETSVLFRSIRVDVPVETSGGGTPIVLKAAGEICATSAECEPLHWCVGWNELDYSQGIGVMQFVYRCFLLRADTATCTDASQCIGGGCGNCSTSGSWMFVLTTCYCFTV